MPPWGSEGLISSSQGSLVDCTDLVRLLRRRQSQKARIRRASASIPQTTETAMMAVLFPSLWGGVGGGAGPEEAGGCAAASWVNAALEGDAVVEAGGDEGDALDVIEAEDAVADAAFTVEPAEEGASWLNAEPASVTRAPRFVVEDWKTSL